MAPGPGLGTQEHLGWGQVKKDSRAARGELPESSESLNDFIMTLLSSQKETGPCGQHGRCGNSR